MMSCLNVIVSFFSSLGTTLTVLLFGCIGFCQVQTDEEFHWYLLRCFATYELRCRDAVDGLLHAWGLGDRVDNIWVPTRQVGRSDTLLAFNVNDVN